MYAYLKLGNKKRIQGKNCKGEHLINNEDKNLQKRVQLHWKMQDNVDTSQTL